MSIEAVGKHFSGTMQNKNWPELVFKCQFISCYFLGICRTCTETKVTSETITLDPIKVLTCSTPQNDCKNLSFVKDKHTHGEKMARKGHAKVIYKFSFVSNRSISGFEREPLKLGKQMIPHFVALDVSSKNCQVKSRGLPS